jgi:hypothetical protein
MKRVFSSHNALLVHHFRNLLEAGGVQTEMRNQYLASAMGELPPADCQPELWVEDQDAERAADILRRKPAGPDWRCGCGETLGSQFTQCWHCGTFRTPAPG